MSIGTTALRGVLGPLFVGHGTQKLFGWFGGHGLEGTAGFFESIGVRPGRRTAMAAGTAEALGGALLTLGAFTPVAATLISGTMTTAIRKVHGPNGPWVTDQGYEYPAVIIAAMAMVVDKGPGRPSIDSRLFPNMKGPGWAALAVGAGVAGSFLMDRMTAPAPENAPQASAAGGAGGVEPATPQDVRFTRDETTVSS